GPEDHAGESGGVRVAHVPGEGVHAFAIRRARRGSRRSETLVRRCGGRTRRRVGSARGVRETRRVELGAEGADDLAGGVENLERHFLRRRLEPVLDLHAGRRVLSDRMDGRVLWRDLRRTAATTAATTAAEAAAEVHA